MKTADIRKIKLNFETISGFVKERKLKTPIPFEIKPIDDKKATVTLGGVEVVSQRAVGDFTLNYDHKYFGNLERFSEGTYNCIPDRYFDLEIVSPEATITKEDQVVVKNTKEEEDLTPEEEYDKLEDEIVFNEVEDTAIEEKASEDEDIVLDETIVDDKGVVFDPRIHKVRDNGEPFRMFGKYFAERKD